MLAKTTLLKINDKPYDIRVYDNDLTPDAVQSISTENPISFDTETRGLNPLRDRLCVVQIKQYDVIHVVRKTPIDGVYAKDWSTSKYLRSLFLLHNSNKYAHYARFDVGFLAQNLQIEPEAIRNVCCTKYASKLARTTATSHSLKDVVKSLLGVELDKSVQTSSWDEMSPQQLIYAVTDTLYLEEIHRQMMQILESEGWRRVNLYDLLCKALPCLVSLDLAQFPPESVIGH